MTRLHSCNKLVVSCRHSALRSACLHVWPGAGRERSAGQSVARGRGQLCPGPRHALPPERSPHVHCAHPCAGAPGRPLPLSLCCGWRSHGLAVPAQRLLQLQRAGRCPQPSHIFLFLSCLTQSQGACFVSIPIIIPTAPAFTPFTCSQGRSELCMNSKMCGMQVRGNADYIVNGLCRQLRHLESHPRYGTALIRLQERDLGLGVPATGNGSSESSWLFGSGWRPESSLDPWAHHLLPVPAFLVCFNEASSICADDSIWPVLWSHACTVRRHHRQRTPALQQGTYTHTAEACVRVEMTLIWLAGRPRYLQPCCAERASPQCCCRCWRSLPGPPSRGWASWAGAGTLGTLQPSWPP